MVQVGFPKLPVMTQNLIDMKYYYYCIHNYNSHNQVYRTPKSALEIISSHLQQNTQRGSWARVGKDGGEAKWKTGKT